MSSERRRMRRAFWLTCALLAGALALSACRARNVGNANRLADNANGQSAASQSPAQSRDDHAHGATDNVRRITTDELRAALERGEAVVVDVRGQAAYDRGHVRGAIMIHYDDIGARAAELPRDKMIVTYCS